MTEQELMLRRARIILNNQREALKATSGIAMNYEDVFHVLSTRIVELHAALGYVIDSLEAQAENR